jgi:hypothetical protein
LLEHKTSPSFPYSSLFFTSSCEAPPLWISVLVQK